ncbi:MAG: hypothetical protein QME96_06980 [Myxococcota bacterium]|nr:hypothetical protein [Myxococcota bacterium]
MTFDELKALDVAGLDRAYADLPCGPMPTGVYRGVHLASLDVPGARRPLWRLVERVGFDLLPYGIDFDVRTWFFVHPRLRVGRFVASPARSRWRPADVISLHYRASRLPFPVRDVLYDEVKPLSATLCLGLGGVDAGPGEGDRFFFALVPWSP